MANRIMLADGEVRDEHGPVLTGLSDAVVLEKSDGWGGGVFLRFIAEKQQARHVFPIGDFADVIRFTCCHRYEPFWMTAKAGATGADVPPETQYLLAERNDGSCLLLVPLIDGAFRCSLQGAGENGLALVVESGDDATVTNTVIGLQLAIGPEPFALLEAGARAIKEHLQTGRLRREKSVPDFVDSFGWCTWDAFYQDVNEANVREGLKSFQRGGVSPTLLILDDGWQSIREYPTGDKRLTSFSANEKFNGDLSQTVRMAKNEFDIHTFLVWHAVGGYWGGVDGDALPGYGVRSVSRRYSPGIHHYYPNGIPWFGTACGVVSPEHIYRFYQDYHRHLRRQGVDGVKVDNQASLEGLGEGSGGRVALMRAYHEALEGSVHTHFSGNLINCMSCANEMLFSALNSNLTRTSTDFWPNRPESHGAHLYVNAQVSAFWGEFVLPDWDMFQSGHEAGAFHAAGRAVSGGPVYVSDKPGQQNFDLLRKLVLPNGDILRASRPGCPTRDCLFADPTKENVLLKIWNTNGKTLMIGAFHARYGDGIGAITGTISPSDISPNTLEVYDNDFWAVYAHYSDELRFLKTSETWDISLDPLSDEVFTIAPIVNGVGAIGLADMLNSGGALYENFPKDLAKEGLTTLYLQSGGRFVAWCETMPSQIRLDAKPISFVYDETTQRLTVFVAPHVPGLRELEIIL